MELDPERISAPIATCPFITVVFLGRQLARLVEDVLRDANLADIVEQGRRLERAQRGFVGDAELAGQRRAVGLYPPGMAGGHVILRIDGGGEGLTVAWYIRFISSR